MIHKSDRVRKLVSEAGVDLLYLPAYSPDLNPIEFAFARLKAVIKQAEARSLATLSTAVRKALDAITLADVQAFFTGCGYKTQYL